MAKTVLEVLDEEDRESVVPTDAETREIAGWVSKVQALEEKMAALEAELTEAKAQRRHVTTVDLPLAFQALGITRMDLAGLTLTIRDIVAPNVKKDDVEAMHLWLEENGHGDLIKRLVKVPLGRGEDEALAKLEAYLSQERIEYDLTEGVAHNTLAAWAKMMVTDGQELPDRIFNLWIGQEVLLRQRKEKK
jgi:hypothetical protein